MITVTVTAIVSFVVLALAFFWSNRKASTLQVTKIPTKTPDEESSGQQVVNERGSSGWAALIWILSIVIAILLIGGFLAMSWWGSENVLKPAKDFFGFLRPENGKYGDMPWWFALLILGLLIGGAVGFYQLVKADGQFAKYVTIGLFAIGVILVAIGPKRTTALYEVWVGDYSHSGNTVSSAKPKSGSSADRSSMQQVVKKRLLLPPHGKVTLTRKGHCYVDNRFDDVLRNTHRYKVGKKLVFTSDLNEPFKLVVWFYNTNLSCEAGGRKLYTEGKFL